MAKLSRRQVNNDYKEETLAELLEKLALDHDDVMKVASGTLTFPFVNKNGEDEWVKIVISVPTGSRDGEPYDGYAEAEDFKLKEQLKEEKNKELAEKKAKKIQRDKEMREKKAAAKAKAEKEKEEE